MKTTILIIYWFFSSIILCAQEKEESNTITEQQLESEMERDEKVIEDDSYLQYLEYFKKHPVNLNTAGEEELRLLNMVSDVQIAGFLRYRKLMGTLIDIYELQAVPGWDIAVIKRILPYITIQETFFGNEKISRRFLQGDNSLLMRVGQVLGNEYKKAVVNKYLGMPASVQVRYKYQYKNLMQWGMAGDKDAGEAFFKKAQKSGFDFYSAHFFIRKINKIKALALGDYTVNMGQGLIQWQGFTFKKSSTVLNIKRQGPVLQPYSSAGEFNFHRGGGITLQEKKWELTLFSSFRKLNANLVIDSIQNDSYVSAILTSGYHRTPAEIADKKKLQMMAFGGSLRYRGTNGSIGLNSVNYNFSSSIKKEAAPYNLFALTGNKLTNYSLDYSYTFKNVHLFGEAASDDQGRKAFLAAMVASLDRAVDFTLLYRRLHKGYQSLFSNAFTERSVPTNENGLYTGISVRPLYGLRLDAYMDMYQFPWLSARIDAPAFGKEYLIQLTYAASKNLELYTRYRIGSQPVNCPGTGLAIRNVLQAEKQTWRIHINYSPNKKWTLRNRMEMVKYNKKENGFLGYTDFFYTPLSGFFSGNLRIQYFETDNYDSRLYAYENDVLYSYSIPSYYGKGIRWYVNTRMAIKKKNYLMRDFSMTAWLKIAQTIDFNGIGTEPGIEGPAGKHSPEVKIQFFLGWQKNNN